MHGYAVVEDREEKARKIVSVLEDFLQQRLENKRILDIGCGSGHIAKYLARKNMVTGVDVVDQVTEDCRGAFELCLVDSEKLPFSDNHFDIVISNHVIAYVGDQQAHFAEIRRVMKKTGAAYFAAPNRNFPVEPHYKTPLINYLPNRWYLRLLKWQGRYRHDVRLLSRGMMLKLFKRAGLRAVDYTVRLVRDPKRFQLNCRALPFLPSFMSVVSPTNVFLLTK